MGYRTVRLGANHRPVGYTWDNAGSASARTTARSDSPGTTQGLPRREPPPGRTHWANALAGRFGRMLWLKSKSPEQFPTPGFRRKAPSSARPTGDQPPAKTLAQRDRGRLSTFLASSIAFRLDCRVLVSTSSCLIGLAHPSRSSPQAADPHGLLDELMHRVMRILLSYRSSSRPKSFRFASLPAT
jgi:hypothetical protein